MTETVSLFIRDQAFFRLGWTRSCELSIEFSVIAEQGTPEGATYADGYAMAAGV